MNEKYDEYYTCFEVNEYPIYEKIKLQIKAERRRSK